MKHLDKYANWKDSPIVRGTRNRLVETDAQNLKVDHYAKYIFFYLLMEIKILINCISINLRQLK
jgi:hypothetical protein